MSVGVIFDETMIPIVPQEKIINNMKNKNISMLKKNKNWGEVPPLSFLEMDSIVFNIAHCVVASPIPRTSV